jgi:hypothetical protein
MLDQQLVQDVSELLHKQLRRPVEDLLNGQPKGAVRANIATAVKKNPARKLSAGELEKITGYQPPEKEPASLKAALRLFLKRICDHYGDHRAVRKHPSKKYTYHCRCPAHDDSTPSLSVTIKKNRLVFHCLATSKCGFKEILKALDFKPQWCFAPVTVKRLSKAKKLPAEFLATLGCKD